MTHLRKVGDRIRACLEDFLTKGVLDEFDNAKDACPFNVGLIEAARFRLVQEFRAELVSEGYQRGLLKAMLTQANDPDTDVLPTWLVEGCPIGICEDTPYTGVFPQTDGLTAAAKASQAFALMDDWDGAALNYQSFRDAGEKAQRELDRMVEHGWATRNSTWADVVAEVGEASLTKMARIIKEKQGREKVRDVRV